MYSSIHSISQSDWEFLEELNERIRAIERYGVRVLRFYLPSHEYQRLIRIGGENDRGYQTYTHKTRQRSVAIYERRT